MAAYSSMNTDGLIDTAREREKGIWGLGEGINNPREKEGEREGENTILR